MSEPTSVNAEGIYEPFDIERVPWAEYAHGTRYGMRYQHLTSYGGGTQISVSMEVLEPGRQANQAHYHLLEEEHVYVLEGSLTLRLGDRRYPMPAGHYVCFPAGQKAGHALINEGDVPCRYLVLGNPHPHEVVMFTDSGRVGVKLTGAGYRGSATVGYWDDVDAN